MKKSPASVEEYIQQFPDGTQKILQQLRKIVLENSPDALENISYGMPAYKTFKKPLIYFAAYDKHIGLYATPSGHEAFKKELSIYKQGKGSVQFPLDVPMPYSLIERIVKFRSEENKEKFGQ